MFVWVRTASVAQGKFAAYTWAKEIAACVKDCTGVDVEVLRPVGGGNPYRIGWSMRVADLAAIETANKRLAADPRYMELLVKGAENFIPGSSFDAIWETF